MSRVEGFDVSWAHRRELFSLARGVAHLNHGSYGAVPIPVQRAQQRFRDEMEANPMAFFTRGLVDRIAHTRRHVAAFLGADPEGTALVPNVTAGTHIVLGSLSLTGDDEILLSDHGYGTIGAAARRTGAITTEVHLPLDAEDDETVAILANSVRPGRTRLAIIDHVTSPTARVLPVAGIAATLRDLGVAVLVDAAHAPGMLPVDVTATGADFWVGNLHKWGLAPRPTAVLAVAADHRRRIRPLVASWEQAAGFPSAVEYGGTLDYTAWLAAPTAVHVLHTLGLDRVRRHNADLAVHGQAVLSAALDVEVVPGSDLVSMRLIQLPRGVADELPAAVALRSRIAAELAAEVAVVPWHGRGYLRVSAQIYNRADEYERLAARLPRLLAGAQAA